MVISTWQLHGDRSPRMGRDLAVGTDPAEAGVLRKHAHQVYQADPDRAGFQESELAGSERCV